MPALSFGYSNLTGLTYKLGHTYFSGILHYTPASLDAWNVDTAHPLALEQGVYIGVIKIAVNNRDSGHYLDFPYARCSRKCFAMGNGRIVANVSSWWHSFLQNWSFSICLQHSCWWDYFISVRVGSASISEVIYEVSFVKIV